MDKREKLREAVLEIITIKLAESDHAPDDIMLAVDEIEQVVLNYCMIPLVPFALRFTLANMTIDLLNYHEELNKDMDAVSMLDIDMADVSSVKVGDTRIDIGDGSKSTSRKRLLGAHKVNLDAITMNYRQQLNQFRRLW